MSKIIIGLVGQIASGKDATKKYLENKYKAKSCRFSTILRDVLNRVDVEIKRENLQKISTVLRQAFGEDLFAKTIAKDASGLDSDIVIVDGVRRKTDISHLTSLPNFFLIKVVADEKIRYERMKKRNENGGDDKKTFEDFIKDHQAEADREVPIVMASAELEINNDGSFEDLYKQIDELIAKIRG